MKFRRLNKANEDNIDNVFEARQLPEFDEKIVLNLLRKLDRRPKLPLDFE